MEEVNQQFGDDSNGSGRSRTSSDEIARVYDINEDEMERERAFCIYKEIIKPMIRADINPEQQKFLSLIKEKFGLDFLKSMTRNFESTSGSQTLQLKFLNGISTPISTGINIQGENHKPFIVALVDKTGKIMNSGAQSAAKIEIVVLEGDCDDNEAENLSSDEFNNKIVSHWNDKKVLQGNTFLNLKQGIAYIDKLSFTHNSTWKRKSNYRLGARVVVVNEGFAPDVKEAITKSFLVGDKRNSLYYKRQTPYLCDELWRLKMISRRGEPFDRMSKANIKTVMDFRTLHAINPKWLKDIVDVSSKKWKVITDHAQKCKDDKGIYLYYDPRNGQKSNGVVFNIFGQLVGLTAGSQFISSDYIPSDKKANAEELIVSSSENWKEVIPFTDQASLINHLHSPTTLNSLQTSLNIVIPKTIDPISCINHENNHESYDNIGQGQSQSPKRLASELIISNSPKKQRDDSPSSGMTCNETFEVQELNKDFEEDDIMQYLKFIELDKWKMVWYVVGWVSMISKVRKRRTTFCHRLLQTKTSNDDKMFVS